MEFEISNVHTVLYACPVERARNLLKVNAATMEVAVQCEVGTSPPLTETFTFDAIHYAPFKNMLYTSALAATVHQQFVAPLIQARTGTSSPPGTQCITLVQGGPPAHVIETFRVLSWSLLEDAVCLVGDYASHRFRIECAAVVHTPAGTADLLHTSQDLSELDNPWEGARRRALPLDRASLAIQELLQHVAPAAQTLNGMRQLRVCLVDTRTGQDVTSHTLCMCPPMAALCNGFLENVTHLRESILVARRGACSGSLLTQALLSGVCTHDGVKVVDHLVAVSCVMDSSAVVDANKPAGMTGRALWETCEFGASVTTSSAIPCSQKIRTTVPTTNERPPSGAERDRVTQPVPPVKPSSSDDPAMASVVGRVESEWRVRVDEMERRAATATEAAHQRLCDAQQKEREAARLSAALEDKMARMRNAYHTEAAQTATHAEEARQLLSDYEQRLDAFQARLHDAHQRALTAEREAEKAEARLEGFHRQAHVAARRLEAEERDASMAATCLVMEEEQSRRLTLMQMEMSQRQSFYLQRERDLAEASYEGYIQALQHNKATTTAQLQQLHEKRELVAAQTALASHAAELVSQNAHMWADELVRRQRELSDAADAVLASQEWHVQEAAVRADIEEASHLLDAIRTEMQQSLDAKAHADAVAAADRRKAEDAIRQLQREKEASAQHLDAILQSITEGSEKYAQLMRDLERGQAELDAIRDTQRDLVSATKEAQKQYADTRWLLGEKERELEDTQTRAEQAARALDATLAHVRDQIESATRDVHAHQEEANAQEKRRRQLAEAVEALLERQRQAEAAVAEMATPEYQSAQSLAIEALRRGEEAKRREAAVAQSLQDLTALLVQEESVMRRRLQQTQEAARSALSSDARCTQAVCKAAEAELVLKETQSRATVGEAERDAFVDLLLGFCVPHLRREAEDTSLAGAAARDVIAAREEKAALEEDIGQLLEAIEGLQAAKDALSDDLAEVVQKLNEATDEMEEEESLLTSEAARAQRLVRIAETDAATRFDAILGRCTELISQSRRRQSSIASLGTSSLSAHPGATPFTFPPVGPHAHDV